jgi:hypothetical protein
MKRSMTLVALSMSIKLLKRVMKPDAIKGSSNIFFFFRTLCIFGARLLKNFLMIFEASKSFGVSSV